MNSSVVFKKQEKKDYTVLKGTQLRNPRVIIYGVEGIGKSTFASKFPDVLLLDIEDRTRHIDVNKIRVSCWKDLLNILDNINAIIEENKITVKTIVIDSLDWVQKDIAEYICSMRKVDSIEEFGYGKGYVYIYEEILKLVKLLDGLSNFNIVVVCHSIVRKFEDPFGITYDRYTLKLLNSEKVSIADTFKEWADYMFFLNYKAVVKNGSITDVRTIFTNRTSRFDGKRSLELQDEIEMTPEEIDRLIKTICV